MSYNPAVQQWISIRQHIRSIPPGNSLVYNKKSVYNPKEAGAHISSGWPVGQISDYRFPPESDGSGVHVHEFEDCWKVHLDFRHPTVDLIEHLRVDAPEAWLVSGTIVGGLVGSAITKNTRGMLVGAGIGLLLSLLTSEKK